MVSYAIRVTFNDGTTANGHANFVDGSTSSSDFRIETQDGQIPGALYASGAASAYADIDGQNIVFQLGAQRLPPMPPRVDYRQFAVPFANACNVAMAETIHRAGFFPPPIGRAGGCVEVTEVTVPHQVPAVPLVGLVVLGALLWAAGRKHGPN